MFASTPTFLSAIALRSIDPICRKIYKTEVCPRPWESGIEAGKRSVKSSPGSVSGRRFHARHRSIFDWSSAERQPERAGQPVRVGQGQDVLGTPRDGLRRQKCRRTRDARVLRLTRGPNTHEPWKERTGWTHTRTHANMGGQSDPQLRDSCS